MDSAGDRSFETVHRAIAGDSRSLDAVADDAIALVVTSPPYPMIEQWDGAFAALDPAIGEQLDAGRGREAFEAMHDVLAGTWEELERVLIDGGVVAVVVGDATRRLDGRFERYPNHARITEWFTDAGYDALPSVLWRKPTNAATKFMGSGMLPTNAYATLEHEHVLLFRNGGTRSFPPGDERRYESAYFWEERNRYFSDVWADVAGERQALDGADSDGECPGAAARERSAAFPLEVPTRLLRMYSVYADAVLDPFWGTGTTTLAAMLEGRSSVGYELDAGLIEGFDRQIEGLPARSRERAADRLAAHAAFVDERRAEGESLAYDSAVYDLPVTTKQERRLRFYAATDVERSAGAVGPVTEPCGDDRTYRVAHEPVDWSPGDAERAAPVDATGETAED